MTTTFETQSRAWAGWLVVLGFLFLFGYVALTGHGLSADSAPLALPPAPAAPPSRDVANSAPDTIASNPAAPSPDWLNAELRKLGLLSADEQLIRGVSDAWPDCDLIVAGPGGSYRGRVCASVEGLYRRNADGADSGLRWTLDASGVWIVTTRAEVNAVQ